MKTIEEMTNEDGMSVLPDGQMFSSSRAQASAEAQQKPATNPITQLPVVNDGAASGSLANYSRDAAFDPSPRVDAPTQSETAEMLKGCKPEIKDFWRADSDNADTVLPSLTESSRPSIEQGLQKRLAEAKTADEALEIACQIAILPDALKATHKARMAKQVNSSAALAPYAAKLLRAFRRELEKMRAKAVATELAFAKANGLKYEKTTLSRRIDGLERQIASLEACTRTTAFGGHAGLDALRSFIRSGE